mgnify:FL=1
MDKQGISYKTKDNAFIQVEDPDQLQNIVKELNGKAIMDRAEHCLPALPATLCSKLSSLLLWQSKALQAGLPALTASYLLK